MPPSDLSHGIFIEQKQWAKERRPLRRNAKQLSTLATQASGQLTALLHQWDQSGDTTSSCAPARELWVETLQTIKELNTTIESFLGPQFEWYQSSQMRALPMTAENQERFAERLSYLLPTTNTLEPSAEERAARAVEMLEHIKQAMPETETSTSECGVAATESEHVGEQNQDQDHYANKESDRSLAAQLVKLGTFWADSLTGTALHQRLKALQEDSPTIQNGCLGPKHLEGCMEWADLELTGLAILSTLMLPKVEELLSELAYASVREEDDSGSPATPPSDKP